MNRTSSKLTRRMAPAVVVLAGLAFTGTASAHNINTSAADKKCKAYVQGVVDDPQTSYDRAKVRSTRAFSGHNHYVRCTAKYDTRQTASTKDYACTETLDVYLLPEGADSTRTIFMRHTSRPCGPKRLTGPRPG